MEALRTSGDGDTDASWRRGRHTIHSVWTTAERYLTHDKWSENDTASSYCSAPWGREEGDDTV